MIALVLTTPPAVAARRALGRLGRGAFAAVAGAVGVVGILSLAVATGLPRRR